MPLRAPPRHLCRRFAAVGALHVQHVLEHVQGVSCGHVLVTVRRGLCNSIPAPGVFAGAMAGVQQPMLAGQSVQQPMQWPGSSMTSRYMASPFPGMSLSQQATTGARITPVAGVSTPQFMGATQVVHVFCVHAWTRAWLYS